MESKLGKVINSLEEFNEEVKTGRNLAFFMTDWCGPCNALRRSFPNRVILREFLEENKISNLDINVDKVPSVASECRVKSVPAIIAYEYSQIKGLKLGYDSQKIEAKDNPDSFINFIIDSYNL